MGCISPTRLNLETITSLIAPGRALHIQGMVYCTIPYITHALPNRGSRGSFKTTAACNLPKNNVFLIPVIALYRASGTGYAISITAKMPSVSQIILDHFTEALILAGLVSFG
jgi:hypothetical protein